MPITFNGDVTINGRAEFYSDGSVRISNDQVDIHIDKLSDFIEQNLSYSVNKDEYKKAAEIIRTSTDKNQLKSAWSKILNMGRELGKGIWISGLSQMAIGAGKELISSAKELIK